MRMRTKSYLFCACCGMCFAANASLLRPAAFPQTASDLSFVDQIALAQAGYESFDSKYDENGHCIAGCAYVLPKMEDEIAAMERWNTQTRQDLTTNHGYVVQSDGNLRAPNPPQFIAARSCQKYDDSFYNSDIPYRNPLGRMACITSPYAMLRNLWDGTSGPHYALDFRAALDAPVYAPANGTVDHVINDSKCGKGILLNHPSGYSTLYCHLNQVLVSNGQFINSGCLIGRVGMTGHANATHLHYAVKNKNGNAVDPTPFIEAGHTLCGK